MIKRWIMTGDTHGQVAMRLDNIVRNMEIVNPAETAVIILGDVGLNFYCNKSENKKKAQLKKYGLRIYCVRGNHEERPENLGFETIFDEDVMGNVYVDPSNDDIRYFEDGGEYIINNHSVLVIGGAYSVDKYWRLQRAAAANQSFTGWFKDEQLTREEMNDIQVNVAGKQFDFVFTHTCPIGWEPSDLFLGAVDQSTVDKTMEIWLDEIKNTFEWKVWCFGHYHADRLERPCVEQMFQTYEDLEVIWNRWYDKKTIEAEWWITKSPNFYMDLPRNENEED
jgi:3-oxoacid CoA-transferase subunit A